MRKVFALRFLFSIALMSAMGIACAADSPKADDCLVIETTGEYSLFTNKCRDTINLVWFYEGTCAAGCSDKLAAKYHKYVSVLKDPYTIAVCFSPKEVDPKWKGVGPATCK